MMDDMLTIRIRIGIPGEDRILEMRHIITDTHMQEMRVGKPPDPMTDPAGYANWNRRRENAELCVKMIGNLLGHQILQAVEEHVGSDTHDR